MRRSVLTVSGIMETKSGRVFGYKCKKKEHLIKRLFLNLRSSIIFTNKHLVNKHMKGNYQKIFLKKIFCAQRTGNLSRKKSDRNVKFFFLMFTFFDSVFSLLRIILKISLLKQRSLF